MEDHSYLELIYLYGEQVELEERKTFVDARIVELEMAAKETVKVVSGNSPPELHRGSEPLCLLFERTDGRVFCGVASTTEFYPSKVNGDMIPYLRVTELTDNNKLIIEKWGGDSEELRLFVALR